MYELGYFEILVIVMGATILLFTIINIVSIIYYALKWNKNRNRKEEEKKSLEIQESKVEILVDENHTNKFKTSFKNLFSKLNIKRFKINFTILLIINLVLIGIFYFALGEAFNPGAAVKSTYPAQNEYWTDYSKPIEIEFSRPIRKEVLEIYLNDEIEGEWRFIKSFDFLPFVRYVQFHPENSFTPEKKYKVYVVNFNKYDIGEYPFDFYSAKLPEIKSVNPTDQGIDIMPDSKIDIELNREAGKYVDFDFSVEPEESFEVQKNDQSYSLIFDNNLKQTTKYKIEVYRQPQTYNLETEEVVAQGDRLKIHETYFRTIKAPLVESYSPEGTGVRPDSDIQVIFDEPMKQEEVENAFSISPNVEGEISWSDDRTFIFDPIEDLPKETSYQINFAPGISSVAGGITEIAIEFRFTTVGKVQVQSFIPVTGTTNFEPSSSIGVTFDQEVDKASAQSKFRISPSVRGTFTWYGNKLVFKPNSPLAFSTTYTVQVLSGVKTIYGLDSVKTFSTTFTTRSSTVILNITHLYQSHPFACNSAATAMVLSYKGSPTNESQVYNNAGAGPQSNKCSGYNCTGGGNPHVGWVPNYGVYWGPIRQYVQSRGYSATLHQNWDLTSALREIKDGNPVIIWWQNGVSTPTNRSYTASDGTYITAVNGMHSVVIIGYRGTPENPTAIYYHDPYFGATRQRTPSSFDFLWSTWRIGGVPASYRRVGLVVE